jgi:anti-anti-sigma factor
MGSDSEGNPASDFLTGDELGGRVVLSISSRRRGSHATIEIEGELDMQGTARLKDELRKVLTDGIDVVEIDASQVRFVDSAGLTALLAAQAAAAEAGAAFRVAGASAQFARVVNLAGLGDLLLPAD